jgi:hypothetical protein
MTAKSLPWITVAVLATMTGLYPAFYYIAKTANPGILVGKSAELLASYFYGGSFYTHITFGGIALLIGWMQFSKKIRAWNINLHRGLGKAYMTAVAEVLIRRAEKTRKELRPWSRLLSREGIRLANSVRTCKGSGQISLACGGGADVGACAQGRL